ncbi:hypothetical protein [Actinomadura sp. DC4]|uniref:hypothetical protein n=1 Tax=Actinomadura sp. DC4 TaxID=3055069 RepID=UPI0025B10C91|nr:hypothetical protein [Actinomadura sp. DC4]MDN3351458.1 hypothetical protein [Actinomadura sp. DC4]
MSRDIDSVRETPADMPAPPKWRARLLTSMPSRDEEVDGGPKRLTRHERVPEEDERRGR